MEQVEKETIERAIEVVREVEYGADTTEEMGNYKRKVFEALKTLLH